MAMVTGREAGLGRLRPLCRERWGYRSSRVPGWQEPWPAHQVPMVAVKPCVAFEGLQSVARGLA